jgi:hypothetical protein
MKTEPPPFVDGSESDGSPTSNEETRVGRLALPVVSLSPFPGDLIECAAVEDALELISSFSGWVESSDAGVSIASMSGASKRRNPDSVDHVWLTPSERVVDAFDPKRALCENIPVPLVDRALREKYSARVTLEERGRLLLRSRQDKNADVAGANNGGRPDPPKSQGLWSGRTGARWGHSAGPGHLRWQPLSHVRGEVNTEVKKSPLTIIGAELDQLWSETKERRKNRT